MGGIGQLIGGILGSILPFAKGGVIKGREKEYIVKVKPHIRKLPNVDMEDVDKKRDKYKIKVTGREKKIYDADLLNRQKLEVQRIRNKKKQALNSDIRLYGLKQRVKAGRVKEI